jgi:mono/diheme cytochrome c family protein
MTPGFPPAGPASHRFRTTDLPMKSFPLVLFCWIAVGAVQPVTAGDPAAVEFFEKKVRPVLAENCYQCHGPDKQKADLRLDSAAGIRKGGESGPPVIPGDPDKSLLLKAVRQSDDLKMPPKSKLKDAEIADLAAWIKLGAPWPAGPVTHASGSDSAHWAYQPVKAPPVPQPRTANREPRNPIDAFVGAKLETAGLAPSPAADRVTLIRRLTIDLHGLPPTPAEIDAYVHDADPDADARLVDRLLASPRYGERWGRHWLDVARYADTKGYVFMEERRYPFAFTYRDYVIRSFNEDKPYDRFILEQLAADKLDLGNDPRPLAAMGFLTLGRRFLNSQPDIIDDRIDVTCRGLLGLTVTCARCHDHKFDPIPAKDYYSLYGVFASSVEPKDPPLIETPHRTAALAAYEKELAKRTAEVTAYRKSKQDVAAGLSRAVALTMPGLDARPLRAVAALGPNPIETLPAEKFDKLLNRPDREKLRLLVKNVESFQANSPAAPMRAMALADAPQPVAPHVFLRGNAGNPGPEVPRQFLEVLAGPDRKPFPNGSGRLDLAKAIADPNNPLTARVFVNRVWALHFGKGLVGTPSDFGVRSDPPTHPELLDYLADRFVKDGWSIKHLHRLILLSDTYRQRSDDRPDGAKIDPENRLVWKFNRQRLDFEALRDGMLAVAGRLDESVGGPAVDLLAQPVIPRRTVYGFIDRQNLPGLFRTFDFASPDTHAPQRYTTTVPQQALFLMNSPFAVQQAQALAARPEVAGQSQPGLRIDALYRLLYGRPPTTEEAELGVRFVEDAHAASETKLAPWEQYAQVLLLANEFAFVD